VAEQSHHDPAGSALDLEDVAPLLDLLGDEHLNVRVAGLDALLSLPLTANVWDAVGEYVRRAIQPGEDAPEHAEVVARAGRVPLRSVRIALTELAHGETPSAPVAARALASAGDAAALDPLLNELRAIGTDTDTARYLAQIDVSPAELELEFVFESVVPTGDENALWLALALARAGRDAPLHSYLTALQMGTAGLPDFFEGDPEVARAELAPGPPFPDDVVARLESTSGPIEDFVRLLLEANETSDPGELPPDVGRNWDPRQESAEEREGSSIAASLIEEHGPSYGAWDDALNRVSPRLRRAALSALVTELLAQEDEDGFPAYVAGNAAVSLAQRHAADFTPDVRGLWRASVAGQLTIQPAWAAGRGGARLLVAQLSDQLADPDPEVRERTGEFIARAGSYLRDPYPPMLGGGPAAPPNVTPDLIDDVGDLPAFGMAPGAAGVDGYIGTGDPPVDEPLPPEHLPPPPSPRRRRPRAPWHGSKRTQVTDPAPPTESRGESGVVTRTPHLSPSKEPLEPGEAFEVAVWADTEEMAPRETGRKLVVPAAGAVTVAVKIVASEHFRVDDPKVQTLVLDPARTQTERVMFALRVVDVPPSDTAACIWAHFWKDSQVCGSVRRDVELTTPTSAPPAARTGADRGVVTYVHGRSEPDLMVSIQTATPERPDTRLWECTVVTRHLPGYEKGVTGLWPLENPPREIVHGYMRDFMDVEAATPEQRAIRLKGAGEKLFEDSPQVFQEVYWALVDAHKEIETISIVSQEPYIPWELMIPVRGKQRLAPLGVAHAVGRWTKRESVSAEQRLTLDDSYVVAPEYKQLKNLDFAEDEAKWICDNFNGDSIKPGNFTQLGQAFEAGGRSILHFVCHGGEGGARLMLAPRDSDEGTPDSSIGVIDLAGWEVARDAIAEEKPLVFLNACNVGRLAPALNGIDGLAPEFAKLGASCVVAPIWSVEDHVAAKVARRFYEGVLAGRPLASILQEIRSDAYETGTDSYAAYCFFGDPCAVRVDD